MKANEHDCIACDVHFREDPDVHVREQYSPEAIESGKYHRHVHCPRCGGVVDAPIVFDEEPAMRFKRYTYHRADSLPVEWGEEWPGDEVVRAAGFDPLDEEIGIGRLTEEWNGHRKGALVVSGLTCEGHPFAVQV